LIDSQSRTCVLPRTRIECMLGWTNLINILKMLLLFAGPPDNSQYWTDTCKRSLILYTRMSIYISTTGLLGRLLDNCSISGRRILARISPAKTGCKRSAVILAFVSTLRMSQRRSSAALASWKSLSASP